MFNKSYTTYTRYTAYTMVFLMCVISFGNTGLTNAYYSDIETSGDNTFEAGELDLLLTYPVQDFLSLMPNTETAPFTVDISTTNGSLPFNYDIKVSSAAGVLCDVLTLNGSLETVLLASETLPVFTISTTSFPTAGDNWEFSAVLGDVEDVYSSTTCEFAIEYSGWQFDFSAGKAYHDIETAVFTVTAGSWTSETSTSTELRTSSTSLTKEDLNNFSPEQLSLLVGMGLTLPPETVEPLTDETAIKPKEDGEDIGSGGGGGDGESDPEEEEVTKETVPEEINEDEETVSEEIDLEESVEGESGTEEIEATEETTDLTDEEAMIEEEESPSEEAGESEPEAAPEPEVTE